MPNMKEIQVLQRKTLIKYLRLKKLHPNVPVLEELVQDAIAEMDEEDVIWVKARLQEDVSKF